jgi:hypothetical protein
MAPLYAMAPLRIPMQRLFSLSARRGHRDMLLIVVRRSMLAYARWCLFFLAQRPQRTQRHAVDCRAPIDAGVCAVVSLFSRSAHTPSHSVIPCRLRATIAWNLLGLANRCCLAQRPQRTQRHAVDCRAPIDANHTSDFRLPTSDFRLPTSDFKLPTSNFLLHYGYISQPQ